MECLNCNQEMTNNLVLTRDDRISYDVCEACGSLWLDAGELDKMAFQVAGSIEYCSDEEVRDAGSPSRECPRCEGVGLHKVRFIGSSDIILDRCPSCGGFWLDGGELDLINRELERIMPVAGKGFSEFVNQVHLPYWYKRIRRKSAETDFQVEVPPIKGAELKSEGQAPCPACGTHLNVYTLHRLDIEGCPACRGVWLDRGELRKLKDRIQVGTWRTLRWLDDEMDALEQAHAVRSTRRCPKCEDERLLTTAFGTSDILLDWCPSCHGVWLDGDEFEAIVDYLGHKLDALSSAEMKQQVVQEVKEIWTGPEGTLSEVRDAGAAINALLCITLFEHPVLVKVFRAISNVARPLGL